MKKTISVKVVNHGQMYFPVYKVMCIDRDFKDHVYSMFLDRDMAKKTKCFVDDILSDIYPFSYIIESLVWC